MSSSTLAASIISEISKLNAWSKGDIQEIVEAHTQLEQPPAPPHFDGWIDDISVEGIRAFGATQVARFSRGLTIIYAENGSGKTSLVDAVELLTTGRTSRATQYPQLEAEVRDDEHIQHSTVEGQACSPSARVLARWRSDAKGRVRESSWSGAWGEAALGAPPVHLIARRRLREIIALKAVERAARLGNALGLGEIVAEWSEAQSRLVEVSKKSQDTSQTNTDISELVTRFGQRMPQSTAEQLETRIREDAERELKRHMASAADITSPIPPTPPPIPLPPALPIFDNLKNAQTDLEASESSLSEAPTPLSPELLDLLRAFKVAATPHTICPACDNGTVEEERLIEIERLLSDADLETKKQLGRKSAMEKANRALASVDLRELAWHLPSLEEPAGACAVASGTPTSSRMQELDKAFKSWTSTLTSLRESWDSAVESPSSKTIAAVLTAMSALGAQRSAAEKAAVLAETERVEKLRERLSSIIAPEIREAEFLKQNAPRIAAEVVRARLELSQAKAIKEASAALKDRLNQVVAAKCEDLAEPINSWLERLAPENTPDINVSTRKTPGRTALDLFVAGGKVRAIGRLSDSQLDMLGLAAHLATLEREAPGQPLFIDDPTDMLDHRTRDRLAGDGIARLLQGPSDRGRQVVVLTHDDQFVRSLWRHHGNTWPTTSQLLLEVDHSMVPPQTLIVPRTAQEYVARVKALLSEHPNDGNRLWLRSAAGNQLRQSIEVIAKDVHTVLGPLGLQYLQAGTPALGDAGAGAAFDAVAPTIRKIQESHAACGEPRHYSARGPIAKLLDSLDRRKEYMLDEASHSDFVYPSVERIREYASQLQQLTLMLASHAGAHPDEWPKKSRWAHSLTLCPNCEPIEVSQAA